MAATSDMLLTYGRETLKLQIPGILLALVLSGVTVIFDSFKWRHICYNLCHPVFGTRTDREGNRRRLWQGGHGAHSILRAGIRP